MKKELLKPVALLAAALGTSFLTGCASNQAYTESNGALSAVAFTTVTDSRELIKWTESPFLSRNLRSIDTYRFQVPYTGAPAGNEQVMGSAPAAPTAYAEGMGGTASGAYQSETETASYRTIRYRPGISR